MRGFYGFKISLWERAQGERKSVSLLRAFGPLRKIKRVERARPSP
jgi:hypothetical protein